MLAELAHGDLDIILMADAPASDPTLTIRALFREPLWMAMPLDHRLAGRSVIQPGDLAGEQLIMLELGDGLRLPAMELCRAVGGMEHPDFRATSLDSLRQMVATGLGVTLLPALYVEAEALADRQIAVRPFAAPPPFRPIDLVWRRTTVRQEEFTLFSRLIEDNLPHVVERPQG